MDGMLEWPQSKSGHGGKEKNPCPYTNLYESNCAAAQMQTHVSLENVIYVHAVILIVNICMIHMH